MTFWNIVSTCQSNYFCKYPKESGNFLNYSENFLMLQVEFVLYSVMLLLPPWCLQRDLTPKFKICPFFRQLELHNWNSMVDLNFNLFSFPCRYIFTNIRHQRNSDFFKIWWVSETNITTTHRRLWGAIVWLWREWGQIIFQPRAGEKMCYSYNEKGEKLFHIWVFCAISGLWDEEFYKAMGLPNGTSAP